WIVSQFAARITQSFAEQHPRRRRRCQRQAVSDDIPVSRVAASGLRGAVAVTQANSIRVIAAAILIGVAAAVAPHLVPHATSRAEASINMAPGVGMPGGPPTSAAGLEQRVAEMETRLRDRPDDLAAAVLLSDALLRLARATNDGRPANRANTVL